MGFLYVNSAGDEVVNHSYSAGIEFDRCPYAFFLKRILGWREKDTKAALVFGRSLEDAIQFFHENKGQGGPDNFTQSWVKHKSNERLKYTKKEVDWHNLNKAGVDMLKLYAIRQPSLPMPMNTIFQREFTKEVFPEDSRLGGISFYGKLDALPLVDPNHPLLPKIEWRKEDGLLRPVIVDIKTSGVNFDLTDGIVAQDLQLRSYSWLRNVSDVAFLWFVKSPIEIKKGIRVTLLEDSNHTLKAGDEAFVAEVNKDENFTVMLLDSEDKVEEMRKAQGFRDDGGLDTRKDAVLRKTDWLTMHGIRIEQYKLTRQRLQFVAARIDKKSSEDAGQIAADQIARIVSAWERNKWTNTFGVRFPHDDRQDPFFKAFVMKDNLFRDTTFEQRNDIVLDDEFEIEGEGENS